MYACVNYHAVSPTAPVVPLFQLRIMWRLTISTEITISFSSAEKVMTYSFVSLPSTTEKTITSCAFTLSFICAHCNSKSCTRIWIKFCHFHTLCLKNVATWRNLNQYS